MKSTTLQRLRLIAVARECRHTTPMQDAAQARVAEMRHRLAVALYRKGWLALEAVEFADANRVAGE